MKAKLGKHGPTRDYRGAHVTLKYGDRDLLGTIIAVRRDEVLGVVVAEVRFFCGDPWPITPRLAALNVLERVVVE